MLPRHLLNVRIPSVPAFSFLEEQRIPRALAGNLVHLGDHLAAVRRMRPVVIARGDEISNTCTSRILGSASGHENVFMLVSPRKPYYLATDTAVEQREWIQALDAAKLAASELETWKPKWKLFADRAVSGNEVLVVCGLHVDYMWIASGL